MLRCQIIPVTAFAQNCSVLWDDETLEAVLIDAGGDANHLLQVVADLGLTVTALWNTHGHVDHIGAVGELARRYAVPVIGPGVADQFWLDALPDIAKKYGFPSPEPVKVTQWLQGGETLTLGQYSFEVRFTPGHTPGHVVFYCAQIQMVWTGDVLFKGSVGRTDFPRGDFNALMQSIHSQLLTLPDATRLIAGHGPMSSIGEEKNTNPFVLAHSG
jgi:hydroxyacylglutathione hydrolase